MSKSSQWLWGGAVQGISILLLAGGAALGWWAYHGHRETLDRTQQLNSLRIRIWWDVLQTSDAIQSWALDPKSEAVRRSGREAQTDFAAAVEGLEARLTAQAEPVVTARKLLALQGRLLEQAGSDAADAVAAYRRNYSAIRDERAELLKNLNQQFVALSSADWTRTAAREVTAAVGIAFALAVVALAAWLQRAAMARTLAGLVGALERMQHGDFSRRTEPDGAGQLSELGEGLNRLAEGFSSLISQVHSSGQQLNTSASQMAMTAREHQAAASELAAGTAEINATSKRICATSRELVKTIDEVSHTAEEATQMADTGRAEVGRMEDALRQITEASNAITAKLALLNERTANINSVVTTITKVADQTNLLSLNAAIEAEKAGEYGLGFAVVAMEIRRLADQTAVATFDIEKAVKEMQSAVAAGVMGMDKFSDEVQSGVEEIHRGGARLAQIMHRVQQLTSRFQTIHEGVHAQVSGAEEISQALAELNDTARQTATSVDQSQATIAQLSEAAQRLQATVVRFKPDK